MAVCLLTPILVWTGPVGATHCTNAAPSVSSITDDAVPRPGAGTGARWAWDGTTVRTTLAGSDPDGDPFVFLARWSDEVIWQTASGGVALRTFQLGLAPGTTLDLTLSVKAQDDPGARCPDGAPATGATSTRPYQVHADPSGVILAPLPGESCHSYDVQTSWNGFDLMAGDCAINVGVIDDSLGPDVLDRIGVYVDGTLHASDARGTVVLPYTGSAVPDGAHLLAACASASTDPAGRLFCGTPWRYVDSDCVDTAPEYAGITADGLLGGSTGWADHPYVLRAFAFDADGDPVRASWTFADGQTATGRTVTHAFAGIGQHTVALRVEDDVQGRCPYLLDLATEVTVPVFRTIADPVARITRPGIGNSCDLNTVFPSAVVDAIAISCEIEAELTSADLGDEAMDQGMIRLDGAFYGLAKGTKQVLTNYNSADRAEDVYGLDACWTITNDKHGRSFCSDVYRFRSIDCSNRAPTVGPRSMDGFGTGRKNGWVGKTYSFDASGSFDLDRDPMTITWTWSDGVVLSGPNVSRVFPAPGQYPVTIRLSDDPTDRCPFMPSYAVSIAGPVFEVIAPPAASLTRPLDRQSCYGGVWSATNTAENIVSGRCAVTATLAGATSSVFSGLIRGELRVDGRAFHRASSTALTTTYDSVMFTFAGHVMDACYRVEGDVHGLAFCTAEYVYLNVGT